MNRPKVGVGVYIIKDNTLLMGLRKGTHGEGDWCPPGGHLEAGESWGECATRENDEESGLTIKNIRLGTVTNDIFGKDDKHYVTIALIADYVSGEPERLEPNKCLEWRWFSMDDLPENLFLPVKNAFEQGFDPFEGGNNEDGAEVIEEYDVTLDAKKRVPILFTPKYDRYHVSEFKNGIVVLEPRELVVPKENRNVTVDSKGTIHIKLPGNPPSGGVSL